MSPKKNLILLLVLIVAAGAYYVYDVKWASEKKAASEKKVQLLRGADPKRLTRIALERPEEPYQIIRTEKGWRFVKPVDAAVDEDEMKTLLKAAGEIRERRRIGNVKDRSEFGMDKPRMKLVFGLKGGGDIVIRIGDRTPTREFYYASLKDGPLFTLQISDIEKFDKKVFDLRDRYIVPVMPEKARKVVVEPEGETPFTVVRSEKDKDKWMMTAPVKDRADSVDSEGIVSTLRWERVHSFVDENPKDLAAYGLDRPRYVVRVYTAKDQKKPTDGLMVGKAKIEKPAGGASGKDKKKPKVFYYARRLSGGPVVLLTQKVVKDLPTTAFAVRYKTVIDYDVDNVRRARLEKPAETIDILRKGKKAWEIRVRDAAGKEKSLTGRHKHIDDLLWDIKWSNAVEYVDAPGEDLAPYGLAEKKGPRAPLRVTVWLRKKKGGPETRKSFLLGPLMDGKKAYGRMEGEKRLFAFAKKDYDKINRSAFYLSERRLVVFDKLEEIKELDVSFPGGGKMSLRRPAGGLLGGGREDGWEFTAPAGKKVREGRVDEFLNAFRDMENEGKAKEVPPSVDFARYRLKVRLVDAKGRKHGPIVFAGGGTKEYLFVRVGEGGRVLRVKRKFNEDKLPKAVKDWVKPPKKEET